MVMPELVTEGMHARNDGIMVLKHDGSVAQSDKVVLHGRTLYENVWRQAFDGTQEPYYRLRLYRENEKPLQDGRLWAVTQDEEAYARDFRFVHKGLMELTKSAQTGEVMQLAPPQEGWLDNKGLQLFCFLLGAALLGGTVASQWLG